jgi:hypothetical protein
MCSVLEVERKNARSAEKTIAVNSEQITGVEEGERVLLPAIFY